MLAAPNEQMMSLQNRRILVVEDEAMIALDLEATLTSAGASVIGPLAQVADAIEALQDEDPDAALLDVNVGGQRVYPVVAILQARGIPFVFLTGYAEQMLPESLRDQRICRKPCHPQRVVQALQAVLGR